MKILILGAGGMLGHKICQNLADTGMDIYGSFRSDFSNYSDLAFYSNITAIENLDVTDKRALLKQLNSIQPDVIINCIGVTTRKLHDNPELVIYINSLFPHQLDRWAKENNSKLIHFSTDCVFSGKASSPQNEENDKTASDLYGQSKSLGEVIHSTHALTLRSSIIGHEVNHFTELLEWTLSKKDQQISGYQNVIYSGVTTNAMSEMVKSIVMDHKNLSGLLQVSSEPISKLNLLKLINNVFSLGITIRPDTKYNSYKVLDSSKLEKLTGLKAPSWNQMISELFNEQKYYQKLNKYNKVG